MQWSHSRVEAFEKCPFNFKMRYLEGAKVNSPIDADNALIVGTALHTGIEKDVQTALKEYFFSYPIISDAHINEAIKLETMISKAKAILPSGEYEVEIENNDFHGFIDLLAPATVFERGVARILEELQEFFPELLDAFDVQIVLDDGTLVAELTPKIDRELGAIRKRKERG